MTAGISRAIVLILVGVVARSPATHAADAQSPAVGRAVVVELYTSQGCSSCPPADALLGELAKRPNIVALAFHVGYWDSIGWRDRFAIAESVSRQERYVETLGLSSAFTPQVVIDGRGSFVGSDRRRIEAALTENVETVPVTAQISGAELLVSLPQSADRKGYDVNVVAYLPQASTAVGRGENSGRTLAEFNIVRQFRRLAAWDGAMATLHVPLESFPGDATRVAVLLQRSQQGPIAGSAIAELR